MGFYDIFLTKIHYYWIFLRFLVHHDIYWKKHEKTMIFIEKMLQKCKPWWIFIGFEYLADACYNCLTDENLDCEDIFDDDGNDDGGWEDYPCSDLGYEECVLSDRCEWIADSDNPNSWGMCVDAGNDDWGDDGGFVSVCENLNYEECLALDFCEWMSDSTITNGMCVDAGNDDWGDDGGWGNDCEDLGYEECFMTLGKAW